MTIESNQASDMADKSRVSEVVFLSVTERWSLGNQVPDKSIKARLSSLWLTTEI